jgi:hypothetical protein
LWNYEQRHCILLRRAPKKFWIANKSICFVRKFWNRDQKHRNLLNWATKSTAFCSVLNCEQISRAAQILEFTNKYNSNWRISFCRAAKNLGIYQQKQHKLTVFCSAA